MSPMSDQPVTLGVLARFHREVILPDIQKIVEESEKHLRDEMHGLHDAVLTRLDGLEVEYVAIRVGLQRVEQRLDQLETDYRELVAAVSRLDERLSRVEKRLDDLVAVQPKYALRSDVQDLEARVDRLQDQIRALQQRLEG